MKITRENVGKIAAAMKGWVKPAPRCPQDHTKMERIEHSASRLAQKFTMPADQAVFSCPQCGLELAPGFDVGDTDGLIEKSKGHTRGDI